MTSELVTKCDLCGKETRMEMRSIQHGLAHWVCTHSHLCQACSAAFDVWVKQARPKQKKQMPA